MMGFASLNPSHKATTLSADHCGKFNLMCNSRSCFAVTSDGAPISRSSARWFIGNCP